MKPAGPAAPNASRTSRTFRAALRLLPRTFPGGDARELAHIYDALDAEARRTRGRLGAGLAFARELPGLAHLAQPAGHDASPTATKLDDDAARKKFNDMLQLPPPE